MRPSRHGVLDEIQLSNAVVLPLCYDATSDSAQPRAAAILPDLLNGAGVSGESRAGLQIGGSSVTTDWVHLIEWSFLLVGGKQMKSRVPNRKRQAENGCVTSQNAG